MIKIIDKNNNPIKAVKVCDFNGFFILYELID